MENEFVKWEAIVDDNNINIKDLPESVQHKIERFETLFEDYEALDENEENENTLSRMEDELLAMDNGICNDLESFIASKKKDASPPKDDKKEDGGVADQNNPQPNNNNNSYKPSWAFWM